MLFNSYMYMFLFLPIVAIGYFACSKRSHSLSKLWLAVASLVFYGWWNPIYVPLILASTIFNYFIGMHLAKIYHGSHKGRIVLGLGVAANLATLAYFKYADFLAENILGILGQAHEGWGIVLPLAISFFTFQQIAYLVDCYKTDTHEYNLPNYMVFVFFFPQLIAGPIVHHKEMMPQFEDKSNAVPNYHHITAGLLLFAVGLFKKIVLADSFAVWASAGFDGGAPLLFTEAWGTSLSYTLQLYFDFSGYTDMALGSALMFNIRLPFNFNSPYKAQSIQDFWWRWHMTLSRFLRDYLYIPLGGSHRSEPRILINILATFILGGLWHGAAWTFVLWGSLHGLALVFMRLWSFLGIRLPVLLSWALTFLFVNAAWVVFRAQNMDDALRIWSGMVDISSLAQINILWLTMLVAGMVIVFVAPNSNILREKQLPYPRLYAILAAGLLFASIMVLEIRQTSEFLYFQF